MADEEFDIMKPISPHLDIGLTMFDKPAEKTESISDSLMKPTSAELDIGSTMFDKPVGSVSGTSNDIMKPTSSAIDTGVSVFDKPAENAKSIAVSPTSPQPDAVPIKVDKPPEVSKPVAVYTTSSAQTSSAGQALSAGRASSAGRTPPPGQVDIDYGYVTPEEAKLLEKVREEPEKSSDDGPSPSLSEPLRAGELQSPLERALEELNGLREETAQAEKREREAVPESVKQQEWTPDLTVEVGGKPVHGKAKNNALIAIIIFLASISVFIGFVATMMD